jgi:hypothetical protein
MTTSYQNYWNKKRRQQAKLNGAMFAITFIAFISGLVYCSQFKNEVYVRETQIITQATTTPHTPSKEEIIALVVKHFPRSHKEMLVILKEENAKLDPQAKNWNCYYEGYWKKVDSGYKAIVTNPKVLQNEGKGIISTWCRKVEDRQKAHSIDCFLLQRQYKGRTSCPTDVPLEEHIEEVATMTKQGRGLCIFSSYYLKNCIK